VQLMSNWHGNMSTSSVAATVWTWFWSEYIYDTFNPWFQQDHVPQSQDKNIVLSPKGGTAVTAVLSEDLAQWVINDPTNAAFSLPDGTTQNASAVMTQAFSATITNLTKSLGNNVSGWTYGKVHSQVFPSLTNIRSLGTAPRPSGGDPNTIDASYGATLSSVGPSWRFIMDWGTHQGYGIYPGGQSENPLSPWYDNQINAWWKGEYYPMYMGSQPKTVAGTWLLEP
jgi:penicillin amidase